MIDTLEVSFSEGFTTITGETGAGKSILLGGLSLVLGKRADLSSLMDKETKCIIEAEFFINGYHLSDFFGKNDLDYADTTIIRREILPSGKSRAFVNDTPVTLDVLSALGGRLVDIHSQHQTLRLTENDFQLRVIDALADNAGYLETYSKKLSTFKTAKKELEALQELQQTADKEHDYHSFLLQELEAAPLNPGIQKTLEEEQGQLSNAESIIESLSQGSQLLKNEQLGLVEQLAELKRIFNNLANYGDAYKTLHQRLESVLIELQDVSSEIEGLEELVDMNPNRLEEVNGQLQTLYNLQKKHQVASIEELMAIKDGLAQKVEEVANIDSKIAAKNSEVKELEANLEREADTIREHRNSVIPKLKSFLLQNLAELGMPSASFKIDIKPSEHFKPNGKDELTFLFSANRGSDFGELKKVASGGELSRIMLTIKSVLATYEQLPTMIFDEIDTGVSGEISNKMGDIMQQMGETMQVFSITHLPQVASKGSSQFKVYKRESDGKTHTQIKQLTEDERVVELAEMLGGKSISDSALAHAKQLLKV